MAATIEDTTDLFDGFEVLDFGMLKQKLTDADEGAGWDLARAKSVEVEYKRYLALCRLYETRSFVPSPLVDTFWHYHILDTESYAEDCNRIFGTFFHHFPYFGMRGTADAQDLAESYDRTLEAYARHFGPARQDIWPRSGRTRCPKCGRGHG